MAARISRREITESAPGLATLDPVLQRLFTARGVVNTDELSDALTDLIKPDQLMGLEAAVERLIEALKSGQHILIVGDFDADGATSTAVSVKLLRQMGAAKVSYLVPNRFTCGYGLTPELVAIAVKQSPDLIVTVDNGIACMPGVDAANAAGIDVVITDHHLPADVVPDAVAIVNPNQTGCPFPSKNLAGVGVAFYLMIALRQALQKINWFVEKSLAVPNLASVLDIVALGTVADVVVLDKNNRILVSQGLKRIRANQACLGIQALIRVAKKDPSQLVAQDLGFAIGPRLNAAGRLEDMSIGIACLLSETEGEAMQTAQELDQLNRSRRDIESGMSTQAFAAVDQVQLTGVLPLGVCVYESTWHVGVVGLVASRVKERHSRPVIAFAKDGETYLKGSARSVPGVHIRDVLSRIAVKKPELIEQFGGHAMAAGLKIKACHYPAFATAFSEAVADDLTEDDCQAIILSDGELLSDSITLSFADTLRFSVPWGQGFPEPVFDGVFELVSSYVVGQAHLKMVLSLDDSDVPIDAIWFRADTERWANAVSQKVQVAYRLDINVFREKKRLQFIVLTLLDAPEASEEKKGVNDERRQEKI